MYTKVYYICILFRDPTQPKERICKRIVGLPGDRVPNHYKGPEMFVPAGQVSIGCYFNSGFYDLALIQSISGIFKIGRKFFHTIHRRIFKNAKTLLIGQILV